MTSARPLMLALAALTALSAETLIAQRAASQVNRRNLIGRQFESRVVRIADADTLEALLPGESRPIRIRLEGVDAPEQGEIFSREATTRLRALTLDRVVRVTGKDVDRYGRLVARIAAGGTDVSRELLRAGLACHAFSFDAALARDEAEARAAGAGFWSAAEKPRCVTRTAFSRRPRQRG